MWNVNERFLLSLLESLPRAGFTVSSTGGVMRVEKYGSGAEFRRRVSADSRGKDSEPLYQMTIQPSIMMGGQFTRLWDAGYQKFLLTDGGHKFPALAEQLANLRRFNEELRTALGVPTYYNEALGSTCRLSTYDRLKGRPGDVPDLSVGVKPPAAHERARRE